MIKRAKDMMEKVEASNLAEKVNLSRNQIQMQYGRLGKLINMGKFGGTR
jgi:hypothetical protein